VATTCERSPYRKSYSLTDRHSERSEEFPLPTRGPLFSGSPWVSWALQADVASALHQIGMSRTVPAAQTGTEGPYVPCEHMCAYLPRSST
jgi:hypothetical protein